MYSSIHNAESENTNVLQIRPLPDGKKYHVFISYRDVDEDRIWIRQLILRLENSYHFICCDHVVDFEPGHKIIENIKNAVTQSVKTVVILTKEYVESYWCDYELEYALLLNMDKKERILIPVLKEECKIPDYLLPFTYIDGRGEIDTWIHKLASAIESEGPRFSNQLPWEVPSSSAENDNLNTLYEDCTRCSCNGPVFDTIYVPDKLRAETINISSEMFTDIMRKIAASHLVKGRHCRNFWWPTVGFWLTFWIVTTLIGLPSFIYALVFEVDMRFNIFVISMLVPDIISMALVIPMCCYSRHKGKKQLYRICSVANQQLMKKNVLVTYQHKTLKADFKVMFVYYNVRECLEYIKSALIKNLVEDKYLLSDEMLLLSENISDGDKEVIIGPESENRKEQSLEHVAAGLLLRASFPYLQDFYSRKLINKGITRHAKKAICICTYMEAKGFIQQTVEV